MKGHRVSGIALAGLVTALLALFGVAGAASAATTQIGFSSDPTEGRPVEVKVSGQAEEGGYLWVSVFPETDHRCDSADAYDMNGGYRGEYVLIYQERVSAGSYQRTATIDLPKAGAYRVCSILADGWWDTPLAKAVRSFTVRKPRSSSVIQVSPNPVANNPATITITGQSEDDRYLWVVEFEYATPDCDSYNPTAIHFGGPTGVLLMDEEPIPAGNYERSVAFKPSGNGTLICSFLADQAFRSVDAIGTHVVQTREPQGRITVTPTGSFRHQSRGFFLLEGTTEASASLSSYLYHDERGCPNRPGGGGRGRLTPEPVEPGPIPSQEWSAFSSAPGTNRICAWLKERGTGRLLSKASATVSVKRNPRFRPRLVTPNGRAGFRPPVLKWRAGPGRDTFQLFRDNPARGAGPIWLKRSWVGARGGKKMGQISKVWFKVPVGPGRYWWWIFRDDVTSGYREYSRPRSFVVKPPRSGSRSRNRSLPREPRSLNRGFPLWTKSVRTDIIPGIDSVSGHSRINLTKEHR